jgi:Cu/Ag efflux protein CusF
MRHVTLAAALALALGAAAAGPAAAQAVGAGPSSAPARMASTHASITGVVTAVDAAQRTVTLKGPQGRERTFTVDPAVQGLENVKAGDRVRLDYLIAVAVALRKGGDGIREKVEAEAAAQDASGGKPAVAAGKRTTVVTNVLAVDRKKQTVRLQGPEGRIADFKVQDKAALAEVKPGDQVVAVVVEGVAVGVKPAGRPGAASSAQ